MKLSEKGKENLAGFGFAYDCDGVFSLLDDYEFDQSDFEGAVILTVEEAKAIHEMLYNYVWEYAFCLTDYDVKLPDDLLSRIKQVDDEFNGEYLRFYEERIEQASGSFQNGKNHSNQSVKKVELTVEEADEVYEWMLRSFRPPREFIDNFLAKIEQAEKSK